jgi:hypothetical protein
MPPYEGYVKGYTIEGIPSLAGPGSRHDDSLPVKSDLQLRIVLNTDHSSSLPRAARARLSAQRRDRVDANGHPLCFPWP